MMEPQPTLASRPDRQHLRTKAPNAETLFQNLICFQAQFETAARQSIGLRSAVRPEHWIRTWSIRGTLQVALAEDTRTLILITRQRNVDETLRVLANHGLTQNEAWDVAEIVCASLAGAGEVPRQTLYDPVANAIGEKKANVALSPWGGVLKLVATQYLLDVRSIDARHTSYLLGDRLEECTVEDAIDSYIDPLWDRFLLGYGPATPRDFRSWLGVNASTLMGHDLTAAESPSHTGGCRGAAALQLPAFDPYIVSTACRGSIFSSPKVRDGVVRRGGWLASCVLSDCYVVGYRVPGKRVRYAIDKRYLNRVRRALPDLSISSLS